MGWICEIAFAGDAGDSAPLAGWLPAADQLGIVEGIISLDAYSPAEEEARDPHNPREHPPLLMLVADFESRDGLRKAMTGGVLAGLLAAVPPRIRATASALKREFYPVEGRSPGTLAAPVSYVVRYVRPAADEALFVSNYVNSHPATQARLPRIRAIMCYFPVHEFEVPGCPAMDYLIGNEVVFDTVDDFNAAMQSPAREELRAHYREFPPFSGTTSHFLMRRERLYERLPDARSRPKPLEGAGERR